MEKDIIIFHHSYLANNWKEILLDQLNLLKETELYQNTEEIHFGCFSDIFENIVEFCKIINEFDNEKISRIIIHPNNECEKSTLIHMQNVCKNLDQKKILYFHLKGVTSSVRYGESSVKNIYSWRKLMEFYVIENWRRCTELLNNNDTVGSLYGTHQIIGGTMNYYSGNFWWSNSEHINKTPSMKFRDSWLGCESLITSIPHKWFNFKNTPPHIDLYNYYFHPNEYR
jgi:hypothetical protein